MPTIPGLPTLHRSWLLRGQFSPSPWGQSISGLLEETEVAFYRTSMRRDGAGGYEGVGLAAPYLTAQCHVELEEQEVPVEQPSVGYVLKRNWWLSMAIPADRDLIPQEGDKVRFTDPTGHPVETTLIKADAPEGVGDHLEMASESWT